MAAYVSFTPTTAISAALFNFDVYGLGNYRYAGPVTLSVSDSFTYFQWTETTSPDIYTSQASGNGQWTSTMRDNVALIAATYTNFINLEFSALADYSGRTPASVGVASDINISLVYRPDLDFAGECALNTDSFGYAGSRGDIIINIDGLGWDGVDNDRSFNGSTYGFHTLMHELGHALGLSHPHLLDDGETVVLTDDFQALVGMGFEKLGFHIDSAAAMYKEYFTIMSYDSQYPTEGPDTYAQTPMILDVIALQSAYGEGRGSTSSGGDTIVPGDAGQVNAYRTYFDTGGFDSISLGNYASGVYLHMGTTITGANHLVGVSMSMADAEELDLGGSPSSLRWFYGEFESATGSAANDLMIGNALDNNVFGGRGDDTLAGGGGNDAVDGGEGADVAVFAGTLAEYGVSRAGVGAVLCTVRDMVGDEGIDRVTGVESLQFADMTVNLAIQAIAQAAPEADVQRLEELYVAFFNRVPDAEGLAYWIGEMGRGQGINAIAEAFYNAGVQYSALTGFSATMSNAAFVNVVYKNVLGRTAGADADGLAYWCGELAAGRATHGSLVSSILTSAHTFKGDSAWGWVADLLDNKIAVAELFAVDMGLGYASPDDSISKGMAIAAAVTASSTADAISLMGVAPETVDIV